MDVTRAPFDDVHVRRAVAHSVDRAGIMKAGFGPYAKPMSGLVPAGELAGVAGSQQASEDFVGDLPSYGLSEAKAKAELAKSAHPQGFSTTIEYVKDHPWQELTVLSLPFGFGASYPDPAPLLGKLVGKTNIGPQKINIANWTTADVDKAQQTITTAGSDSTRWSATRTILTQVADQVPYVPLFTEDEVYALGQGLAFEKSGITSFDLSNGSWIFALKSTK